MNERIKELARHHLVRDEYTEFGWQVRIRYEFDDAELQKFAELIVEECINISINEMVDGEEIDKEDDIEDRCYLRGNNGGIVDAVIAIKEHFGVEE